MDIINIAIDGPSGSGKSTAAKNLAKTLGIEYIDTGAMYRAVAYKALACGVPATDERIGEMLKSTDIDFTDGHIYLDGEDIEGKIRTLEVSAWASKVSQLASCRRMLVDIQRNIAAKKSVVMDGRDIGTNVLPDAAYKFFVTATLDIRAARRYAELKEKGDKSTLEDVKADLSKRDYNDTHRELNPLVKAGDAIEILTDDLDIDGVTQKMLGYIKGKL